MDKGFVTTADFIRTTDAVMINGRYYAVIKVERIENSVIVDVDGVNAVFNFDDKVKVLPLN